MGVSGINTHTLTVMTVRHTHTQKVEIASENKSNRGEGLFDCFRVFLRWWIRDIKKKKMAGCV